MLGKIIKMTKNAKIFDIQLRSSKIIITRKILMRHGKDIHTIFFPPNNRQIVSSSMDKTKLKHSQSLQIHCLARLA